MHKHCVPGSFFFSFSAHAQESGNEARMMATGYVRSFSDKTTHCFVVCGNKKVLTYMEGVKDQSMPLIVMNYLFYRGRLLGMWKRKKTERANCCW